MEQHQNLKWKGVAIANAGSASPEKIWPLFQDFCNLHKWFPNLTTCYKVEGVAGEPGCVRYCEGPGMQSDQDVVWATEKIIAIDPVERVLSYVIVDNNIGFRDYAATIKVLPDSGEGSRIKWSYEASPVAGWTEEQLFGHIQSSLGSMAQVMEEELQMLA